MLDAREDYIEENTVSIWPTVLKYGIIGGIVFVLYKYMGYMTLFSTASLGGAVGAFVINLLLFGGIIFLAIREQRDQYLGGYITMGRCLTIGILTVVFASVLGGVFDYIYMAFIDPDIMIKQTEGMVWLYEMMGMDEDTIEDTLEASIDAQMEPSLLISVGGGAFGGALLGLIMSAIVGAFMKRTVSAV